MPPFAPSPITPLRSFECVHRVHPSLTSILSMPMGPSEDFMMLVTARAARMLAWGRKGGKRKRGETERSQPSPEIAARQSIVPAHSATVLMRQPVSITRVMGYERRAAPALHSLPAC